MREKRFKAGDLVRVKNPDYKPPYDKVRIEQVRNDTFDYWGVIVFSGEKIAFLESELAPYIKKEKL